MHTAEDLFTEGDVNDELIREDLEHNSGNEQDDANASGDEREENDEAKNEEKVVKPKRVVRNPQPKLNVETLKGTKGLLCLEGYFKNKKYKGRGHEQEDLRTIMKTYEYWCHRLFPKLPFDDCLAKIEGLGSKKPMLTYLKRIRADLIFDEEKPIQSDENEENQPDEFDELVTPQGDHQQLTEEQLERIRLNKERADRLRREKFERQKEASAGASQATDYVDEGAESEQLEVFQANWEEPAASQASNYVADATETGQLQEIEANREGGRNVQTNENPGDSMEINLECRSNDLEIRSPLNISHMDTDDVGEDEGLTISSQENCLQNL